MPPKSATSAEEQMKYLLACLKYNDTLIKPNFEKVAEECGLSTKGAAAKRWERLMKANGIASGSLGGQKRKADEQDDMPLSPVSPLAAASKHDPAGNSSDTPEDKPAMNTTAKKQKNAPASKKAMPRVKAEHSGSEHGLDMAGSNSDENVV